MSSIENLWSAEDEASCIAYLTEAWVEAQWDPEGEACQAYIEDEDEDEEAEDEEDEDEKDEEEEEQSGEFSRCIPCLSRVTHYSRPADVNVCMYHPSWLFKKIDRVTY